MRWFRRLLLTAALALAPAPAHAAYQFQDITCETTGTTGTGTVSLAGALTNYLPFVTTITTGNSVPYSIVSGDGKVETGVGVFTDGAPDTLTRVADWSTDGVGAELTLSGTSQVCVTFTSATFTNFVASLKFLALDLGAADTTVDRASAGDIQVEGNRLFRVGGADVPLADGGTGASLSDPGADRIVWWDESDNAIELSSLLDLATEGAPASGDFILFVDAAGVLAKVDWASLPGADVTGRQTIGLSAGGTIPSGGGIAGCTAVAAFDSGSNDVFMRQCSFSASADNAIYYTWFFPKSATESTDLVVQIDWTSATGTDSTDNVIWTAAAVCFSNDDSINGNAFPTVDTVTDTQTAAGDYLITGEITAITPAGSPAEGDGCVLRITRDADNASDNFNGTADLIQARLYYTNDAGTDD